MGRGQVVRRLILAQEIVGSTPTVPAKELILKWPSSHFCYNHSYEYSNYP
jgi:hypothetical protein